MAEQEKLNVVMLKDRIIVLPDEVTDEKARGGIVIKRDKIMAGGGNIPFFGTIVAAGRECKDVKLDDYVSFIYFSGTPFEFNNKTHLILREADIIMVVSNTQATMKKSFLSTLLKK